jgi:hypothetical protein
MTLFEGQTFLDYSRKNGFAISPTLHPLEQAHESAAQVIIRDVDIQKTSDPAQQARA